MRRTGIARESRRPGAGRGAARRKWEALPGKIVIRELVRSLADFATVWPEWSLPAPVPWCTESRAEGGPFVLVRRHRRPAGVDAAISHRCRDRRFGGARLATDTERPNAASAPPDD